MTMLRFLLFYCATLCEFEQNFEFIFRNFHATSQSKIKTAEIVFEKRQSFVQLYFRLAKEGIAKEIKTKIMKTCTCLN